MESNSNKIGLSFNSRLWGILGILVLIFVLEGCVGKENELQTEPPAQDVSEDNLTEVQNESVSVRDSTPNQIRLQIRPSELNRTGRLPVTLRITNPKLNETLSVLIIWPDGTQWYNQTNITHTDNYNWTRTYSINPRGNASYVKMYLQLSENNTVIKRAAYNVSFVAPAKGAK